ncbi:MAG: capsular biosynthesis protein, partial [Cutibacterium acnes]
LDEELYRQYMLLSLHGQSKDALSKTRLGAWEYDVVSPAYKCNMTDVCAAIGLAQMTRYDSMLERRRQIITRYDQALAPAGVTSLRHYEDGSVSSGHLYLANLPGLGEEARNEFIERMAGADVACNVHYKPLPLLSAYRDLGFSMEDFPQAHALYASEVSLPLHTSLTDEQVDYVISCALETLAAMGRS